MSRNKSKLRGILFLVFFVFGFSALADDVVMATSDDLKEFDHLISKENQKKPPEQNPDRKPKAPPPQGQQPPSPEDGKLPPDKDKKSPGPREKFEGVGNGEGNRPDKKGDKNRPRNPFHQRPPPGAANPGDGQRPPPPPPPPGGQPPPPPQ